MTIPEQQKTLFLPAALGALTLQLNEVPKPGPDDILIKIEAAALNPVDVKIAETGLFIEKYPTVLGIDGAGVVAAVGANVTNVKVGERVAAQGGLTAPTGTYQQYFTTPAAVAIKLPDNISFDEGATIAICASTAGIGLYKKHPSGDSARLTAPWEEGGQTVYAGKPAVVLGGSASVGQYALQFLRLSGFSPIITTASTRNAELLKALGATHVLDRSLTAETLLAEIARLAGGPVEIVYDAVSTKENQDLAYDVVAPNGALVLVLHEVIDAAKKADRKKSTVVFTRGGLAYPQNVDFSVGFVKELSKLLVAGLIKPNVPEVLPGGLNAVAGGLERLKAGAVSARKLVVRPQETA